jgi:hypothetical protein
MPCSAKKSAATNTGWIAASLLPWLRQERAAITVLAVFAVGVLSVYGWYVGPNRSGASGATDAMTQNLVVVDVEEHLAIAQFTKYLDPAPIFERESMKSGRTDATVVSSIADRNHWFLKVQHSATRTVCVHLGTLNDDAPKKPSCREASQAELLSMGEAHR